MNFCDGCSDTSQKTVYHKSGDVTFCSKCYTSGQYMCEVCKKKISSKRCFLNIDCPDSCWLCDSCNCPNTKTTTDPKDFIDIFKVENLTLKEIFYKTTIDPIDEWSNKVGYLNPLTRSLRTIPLSKCTNYMFDGHLYHTFPSSRKVNFTIFHPMCDIEINIEINIDRYKSSIDETINNIEKIEFTISSSLCFRLNKEAIKYCLVSNGLFDTRSKKLVIPLNLLITCSTNYPFIYYGLPIDSTSFLSITFMEEVFCKIKCSKLSLGKNIKSDGCFTFYEPRDTQWPVCYYNSYTYIKPIKFGCPFTILNLNTLRPLLIMEIGISFKTPIKIREIYIQVDTSKILLEYVSYDDINYMIDIYDLKKMKDEDEISKIQKLNMHRYFMYFPGRCDLCIYSEDAYDDDITVIIKDVNILGASGPCVGKYFN